MGTKHKHYDVIVAWAAGEEIEFKRPGHLWQYAGQSPTWGADNEYRIKPKLVKKEGWVGVSKTKDPGYIAAFSTHVYPSEECVMEIINNCIRPSDWTPLKIEWEEEQ